MRSDEGGSGRPTNMRRLWLVFLVIVGLGTAAYLLLPSGSPQTYAHNALALLAAAVVLAPVLTGRTQPRAQWLLIGLGVVAFALGDVVYGVSQPVPSVADMFYISSYPLLAVGLGGLGTRRRISHISTSVTAVLVTAMVVFVSWVFLILPGPGSVGAEITTRAVAIGYPVLDLFLMALLIRAMVAEGRVPGTYAAFAAALGLWMLADVVYALYGFGTAYVSGGLIDTAWLLSYGCLGVAVLHPSAWGEDVDDEAREFRVVGRGYVRDVRFGDVLRWSGRFLLVLSGAAMVGAAAWRAPDLVIVGGTYATTGGVMCLVAGRSGTVRSMPKMRRGRSSDPLGSAA